MLLTSSTKPDTQYGIIDAAGSLVSTIWPVIGGLALDWYGYHVVTLLCTSIILVGTIVTALAPATGLWKMMVGGAILQSFGVAALDAAQHK